MSGSFGLEVEFLFAVNILLLLSLGQAARRNLALSFFDKVPRHPLGKWCCITTQLCLPYISPSPTLSLPLPVSTSSAAQYVEYDC
ncbi:hypothetical protein V8F33_005524 [Rhypophila sp. PSN 637]